MVCSTSISIAPLVCLPPAKTLFPDFFPSLLACVAKSYNTDIALNNFERFTGKIEDKNYLYTLLTESPDFLNSLILLFSGSQVLTDTLLKEPAHFDWLIRNETLHKSKSKDALMRDFYELAGTEDRMVPGEKTFGWDASALGVSEGLLPACLHNREDPEIQIASISLPDGPIRLVSGADRELPENPIPRKGAHLFVPTGRLQWQIDRHWRVNIDNKHTTGIVFDKCLLLSLLLPTFFLQPNSFQLR